MALKLDSKIPAGELAQKWSNHKAAIIVATLVFLGFAAVVVTFFVLSL